MRANLVSIQAIIVCLLVAIFYCYEYFLRVLPSVLTTQLMAQYKLSYAGVGAVVATYYLTYMLAQIPVGIILDKYGPRKSLSFACIICALGTILFGITNSTLIASIGRGLVGFGSAFAFVGFLKVCAQWLPHSIYGFMVGLCMLLGMVGAIGGEYLGDLLLEFMSMNGVLQLAAILGLVLAIILFLYVQSPAPTSTTTPSFKKVLTNMWHGFLNKDLWLLGMIGCFTFAPLSSFAEMWSVPFFKELGLTGQQAALTSSMVFLGFGVGGPVWGYVSDYFKARMQCLFIGALGASCFAAIAILLDNLTLGTLKLACFFLGLFTSSEVLIFAKANDLSDANNNATNLSIVNMIVMLGGIVMQPLVGYIIDLKFAPVTSYRYGLLPVIIGLFLASLISLYFLRSEQKTNH